ncbi:hypothetical protein SCHPADRAFT_223269 [Schizopora paradoxa]|uniref:DUF6533 domain-containing protein n=1 Tax=Schizopora paradoxa TaxID=27342 RepID=A0A0H2RWE8_9AGAM|nr:hypothetical protein SCHPADRAFT_223269 [Schizopora paradoxa]
MPHYIPTYNISEYYVLASSVIFYYDFTLTMAQEIKYLWSSKPRLVNVLVLLLRYISALDYIIVIWSTFARMDKSLLSTTGEGQLCREVGKVPGYIGAVCQGLTSVFLIIRLFAIMDKRRWILYLMVPFGVLNVLLSVVIIKTSVALEGSIGAPADAGPSTLDKETPACYLIPTKGHLMVASYASIILFDSLVFALTIGKVGLGGFRFMRQIHRSHTSIASILLRDGILLYAVLAFVNSSCFILYLLAGSVDGGYLANPTGFVFNYGTNTELVHAISVIIVSRMVFNLREAGTDIHEGTMEWHSRLEREVTAMRFRVPSTQATRCGSSSSLGCSVAGG